MWPFSKAQPAANVSPELTIGEAGVYLPHGRVVSDERNAKLSGVARFKTYSEILVNHSIVGAGVRLFANLIGKAEWRFEPATQDPEAERLALLIEEIVFDMETPWHRVVRRAAMHRYYGFSISEWIAKRREDGVIGLLDIAPRPQRTIERWQVDEAGTVAGVFQKSAKTGREIFLPRDKLLYLVDDTFQDSPEGLGLFRHLVDPATRLATLQKFEIAGFGTDLRGVPVGRVPLLALKAAGKTQAAIDKEISAVLEFIEKHNRDPEKPLGIVLDSAVYRGTGDQQTPSATPQWNIELLQAGANSLTDIARAIERLQREMARVLGVEMLLLGSSSVGSHALSADKTQQFGLIVDSALLELSETVSRDVVRPLFKLNGWDEALQPFIKTEAIRLRDVEQMAAMLRDLALAGAPSMPDDQAVGEIYDLAGLSRPDRTMESMIDAAVSTEPVAETIADLEE